MQSSKHVGDYGTKPSERWICKLSSVAVALSGVVIAAEVFKVDSTALFSTDDAAKEVGQQLRGDPPPIIGCTSCKHSTVQLFESQ